MRMMPPAPVSQADYELAELGMACELVVLRRRKSGQDRVLSVLNDPVLSAGTVRVSASHKPFMATAKLVDLLVEPVIAAAGYDFYKDGKASELAQFLHVVGPQACPTTWPGLTDTFVKFIWRATEECAGDLNRMLNAAQAEAGQHPAAEFLGLMPHDTATLLGWHGRKVGDEPADALDPALSSTVEQAMWWADRLGPFELIYDESKLVSRWSERILALTDPEIAAAHKVTASTPAPYLQLVALTPARSEDTPAVQVADVLAGACAELLRGLVLGTAPTVWTLRLRAARVLRFIDHLVWPADDALFDELQLQGLGATA